jgi:outer membrane protein assembly factor BamB
MWNVTTDLNSGLETFFTSGTAVADHGLYAAKMQNGEVWAWNLDNGQIAWKSSMPLWPWGVFGAYHVQSAYGLLIHNDYDGVRAINWSNGNVEWVFRAPTPAFETPYNSQQAFHSSGVVADGKLYTFTCEHTPSQPLTRDWKLYCINMTNGEKIWSISTGQSIPGSRYIMGAVADGYLAYTNEYDFYLYVYGKGKSQTTVTAPQTTVPKGTSVLIQGTVKDMSPAQPNTPCVSAESMMTQMEFIHAKQPQDGKYHNVTVTGVPVEVYAFDGNGSMTTIGTVTSDMSGTFVTSWTPPSEGVYRITANFNGDDSYGSSWAETGLSVGPAPATPIEQKVELPPDNNPTYFAISTIAIIVAIAIATALLLRKR